METVRQLQSNRQLLMRKTVPNSGPAVSDRVTKAQYTLPVFTGRIYGPWTRASFCTRVSFFDTGVHGPCPLQREHSPWTWQCVPSLTASVRLSVCLSVCSLQCYDASLSHSARLLVRHPSFVASQLHRSCHLCKSTTKTQSTFELWPPYGIAQTIIFSSCFFFLWPPYVIGGHYIFAL